MNASKGVEVAERPLEADTVALDPTLTHLYSTNENTVGGVSAYAIQGNGLLSFLNSQASDGSFPAHLSVHPSGQYLLASNYGTGNYPIYPIEADGSRKTYWLQVPPEMRTCQQF